MGMGTEIKKALKERNMTIKELSQKTGISINTLYAITKRDSQNVSMEIIIQIAKVLDMDINKFISSEKLEKMLDLFTGNTTIEIDKNLITPWEFNPNSDSEDNKNSDSELSKFTFDEFELTPEEMEKATEYINLLIKARDKKDNKDK